MEEKDQNASRTYVDLLTFQIGKGGFFQNINKSIFNQTARDEQSYEFQHPAKNS